MKMLTRNPENYDHTVEAAEDLLRGMVRNSSSVRNATLYTVGHALGLSPDDIDTAIPRLSAQRHLTHSIHGFAAGEELPAVAGEREAELADLARWAVETEDYEKDLHAQIAARGLIDAESSIIR